MKKTLILLVAVLLIAGLFIACSADINSADKTASVSFGNGAKGLTYTVTPESLPDVNNLWWWYKAENANDPTAAGTQKSWARINGDEKGFATLNHFKIGSGWTFTIAGMKTYEEKSETGNTDCVYYGTNDAVTLRRGNNTININLNWVSPTSPSVSFSDIVVYESDAYFPAAAPYDTWIIFDNSSEIANGSLTGTWQTAKISTDSIVAEVGSHTYTVKVYENTGDSPVEIATQSVTIYAYPGSTINVTGSIDNLTVDSNVNFNPIVPVVAKLIRNEVETPYASLAEAIDAATDGDTIKLMRDVESGQINIVDKAITLDGNGHTITSTATEDIDYTDANDITTYTCFALLLDVSDDTSAELVDAESARKNYTVKNLTINSETARYGIYCVGYLNASIENCVVTLPGSSVCSSSYTTSDNIVYPTIVTVTDSTIGTSTGSPTIASWMENVLSVSSGGYLTVNNGTFIGSKSVTTYSSGGVLTVNGGTFSGKIQTYKNTYNQHYADSTPVTSVINITGGTFNTVSFIQPTGSTISITGGTFDANPATYVPDGYSAIEEPTGTWTVTASVGI